MRIFDFYTPGRIIKEVREKGLKSFSRGAFYRLEKVGLFTSTKTAGNWRRYSQEEAERIIELILVNYGVSLETTPPAATQ
jgi:hypothetical protein